MREELTNGFDIKSDGSYVLGGPSGSIIGTTYPPQTLSVDGNITAKQLGFIKPKVYYIEYDFKLLDLSEKQTSDSPIMFLRSLS